MIDQTEMILDHFPGNDFLFTCASMADHKSISITCIILNSKSVQSSQFFSLT